MLAAFSGGERVGGAVLAFDTPGVSMLEERRDLTVMWDLRVHPDHWRKGVGTVLFWTAESWAAECGCTELKVETQNINVAACRFYARQGCQLGEIQRHAYPDCPDEVLMFWRKRWGVREGLWTMNQIPWSLHEFHAPCVQTRIRHLTFSSSLQHFEA